MLHMYIYYMYLCIFIVFCYIYVYIYLFYVYPMYIPSHIYLALERLKPLPGRRSGSALPEPAALVGVEAKPFFLEKNSRV